MLFNTLWQPLINQLTSAFSIQVTFLGLEPIRALVSLLLARSFLERLYYGSWSNVVTFSVKPNPKKVKTM